MSAWLLGKGQTGPTLVVAIMGATAPSPLDSTTGARRKQTSFFPGSPRPPALGALPSPRPWVQRLPPRRHRHCRPAVGNRLPSAPTPTRGTGTAAPATGPGAGPGAWSGSRAAVVESEHGAGHILKAAARSCPHTSVGQYPPHRPSCDSPPPSPRRHSHRCLASRRGPLPLGPRPDVGAPGRPPLPAPEVNPETGTPSPLSYMLGPDLKPFFRPIPLLPSGEIPAEDTPRVMGPSPNNFKPIFGRGGSKPQREQLLTQWP